MMGIDVQTGSRRYVLFYVKDKIEYASCDPETREMQQFVIERQRAGSVCEPEKCQDQHDDKCEHNKPLPKVH